MTNRFWATVATGVVLGVLFAPQDGRKSRRQLSNSVRQVRKTAKKVFGKNKNKEINALKSELAHFEDQLSVSSQVKLNTLLDKASKKED